MIVIKLIFSWTQSEVDLSTSFSYGYIITVVNFEDSWNFFMRLIVSDS